MTAFPFQDNPKNLDLSILLKAENKRPVYLKVSLPDSALPIT